MSKAIIRTDDLAALDQIGREVSLAAVIAGEVEGGQEDLQENLDELGRTLNGALNMLKDLYNEVKARAEMNSQIAA
ncbi:MAG TPA: hypothetical protein VIP46_05770 [Pyrinomonadaceae bacterium]